MNDGFKSRKFWLAVGLFVQADLLLFGGLISETVWLAACGGTLTLFTAGNVGEKFAK